MRTHGRHEFAGEQRTIGAATDPLRKVAGAKKRRSVGPAAASQLAARGAATAATEREAAALAKAETATAALAQAETDRPRDRSRSDISGRRAAVSESGRGRSRTSGGGGGGGFEGWLEKKQGGKEEKLSHKLGLDKHHLLGKGKW